MLGLLHRLAEEVSRCIWPCSLLTAVVPHERSLILYRGEQPLTSSRSVSCCDLRIKILNFSRMADIYQLVQSSYGDIAKKTVSSPEQDGGKKIAMAFGYSEEDLLSLPEKTSLGLSCGNPVSYANVKEVCVVLSRIKILLNST